MLQSEEIKLIFKTILRIVINNILYMLKVHIKFFFQKIILSYTVYVQCSLWDLSKCKIAQTGLEGANLPKFCPT